MVPGMGRMMGDMEVDEREIDRIEAMIRSMTPRERRFPEVLDSSRCDRVARGAGVGRPEVDHLLKQYLAMRKMMDGLGRRRRGR